MPQDFPTPLPSRDFRAKLGRTVACFGFLEHTITQAILAFSATKEISENEIETEFEKFNNRLKHALHSPLYSLAELFERVVKENTEGDDELQKINELVGAIKVAADMRNAICHASWNELPDESGSSVPFFAHKTLGYYDASVNTDFFLKTQAHVRDLIYDVMNSVTVRGWKFPGSVGPGENVWPTKRN